MRAKHTVQLSDEQRVELEQLTRTGTAAARVLNRARILLLADRGKSDDEIVDASPSATLQYKEYAVYSTPRGYNEHCITRKAQVPLLVSREKQKHISQCWLVQPHQKVEHAGRCSF